MIWVLSIAAGIFILFDLLLITMWVRGKRLPEEHTATRTLSLNRHPDECWKVISDLPGQNSWTADTTCERQPDRDGREVWRKKMGRNSFILETTRSEKPRCLTRSITDQRGLFSGSWEYEITPHGDGARVRLTEIGRVKFPIARLVLRRVGADATIRKHLEAMARSFGEDPKIE